MLSTLGGLALNRFTILVITTLLITWTLAALLPSYQPILQAQFTHHLSKTHSRISSQLSKTRERIPTVKIDFHPSRSPLTAYNSSKLALLIEARPLPSLVPQLLHMISVVPPDWRFLFIGSNKSVVAVGRSFATQYHQAAGKLDLMTVPKPWSITDKEHVWRMLTDKRFYDEVLGGPGGPEWLLKFESDSIMCANSEDSLNDWLHYDWAGAPRTSDDRFAGNGGLSLRRLSAVRRILSFQERYNDTQAEDEWFGKRLVVIPDIKVAKAEEQSHLAVEDIWHEKPMGYHVREGGSNLPDGVWKNKEQRMKIFEYCPEIVMIMDMKLERERCPGDNGEGELPSAEALEQQKAKEEQAKADKEKEDKAKEDKRKADEVDLDKKKKAKAHEDEAAKMNQPQGGQKMSKKQIEHQLEGSQEPKNPEEDSQEGSKDGNTKVDEEQQDGQESQQAKR